MMNYKEYKEKRQSEFNQLPIFFAFGNKQFEEQLAKRASSWRTLRSMFTDFQTQVVFT
jgi:hypothetical protein